jgi:hypothetical protein
MARGRPSGDQYMKMLLFLLYANLAFSAGWEAVQRIPPGSRIEVRTRESEHLRGVFVSATEDAVVMRSKSGEESITRNAIRHVRVADPSRRMRNGLIATAIGAGAGLAIGAAVCPYCGNEGAGAKFTAPLAAIGGGAGAAAGFLPTPYRTLYRSK